MPGKTKAAHHRGNFASEGAKIRARANADPTYRCPRCRLTLAQAKHRWGKHTHWQSGHLNTGEVSGPMRAECSHCNASHGAAYGNRRRKRTIVPLRNLNTSQDW